MPETITLLDDPRKCGYPHELGVVHVFERSGKMRAT